MNEFYFKVVIGRGNWQMFKISADDIFEAHKKITSYETGGKICVIGKEEYENNSKIVIAKNRRYRYGRAP